MSAAIVGVGTNLGAREAAIHAARDLLDARRGIAVSMVSAIYETAPLGPPQGDYLNAALRLETSLSPPELLKELLRVERRLGRKRNADERWGPRSLDLDLLWDDRGLHESNTLRVPHPELDKRSFALAPLLDVAPELEGHYGERLKHGGGAPPRWERRSIVERKSSGGRIEVTVEADAVEDACAIGVGRLQPLGRPWSTRHVVLEPSPARFADVLREIFRTGFQASAVTVSHCSQSQWVAQFHGTNSGAPLTHDVRLQTTSGEKRRARVRLSIESAAG
jgi:2-amino-4-hydroxy-6-hydroxymethyldihydropteridine diphosphokinase